MDEIPQNPERDAIIDALVDELRTWVVSITGIPIVADPANEKVYSDSIKERIKDLLDYHFVEEEEDVDPNT